MNVTDRKYTVDDVRLVALEPKVEAAAKRWGPKFELKLKRYDVFIGETLIGRVEQHLPTFERKPEGSRIVSSRWKTAHPRWVYKSEFERTGQSVWRRNMYRDFQETRKRALEGLVTLYNGREVNHG